MKKHICCGLCGAKYPLIFRNDETQAHGCSAEVTNGQLCGHYGSTVADMMVFDFKNTSTPKDGTIICDTCITQRVKAGTLVEAYGEPLMPIDDDMLLEAMQDATEGE